jgi:Uma2 family endonuclease
MALSDRPRSRYEETLGDTSVPSEYVGMRMTLAEFLALPEQKPYLEWDASLVPGQDQTGAELLGVVTQKDQIRPDLLGVVTQKVAPQDDHSQLTRSFLDALARFGEAPRLGLAYVEKRFKLVGWSPVPDVSFYRRGKLRPQSRRRMGEQQALPDIAVEIVSPEQRVSSLLRKCLLYAEAGVTVSLIVDQDDESVIVIRPGQPTQVLRGEDRIDLSDVLPDFEMTVDELFSSVVPDWLFDDEQEEEDDDPSPPPSS